MATQCILPVHAPGTPVRVVVGETTIEDDGTVTIVFKDWPSAELLERLVNDGLVMGVSFAYLKTRQSEKLVDTLF